jgi:hypothetical protein
VANKTKSKRLSKGERTHQRRLKQAARKPGGAVALQVARAQHAGEVKKEKGNNSTPSPVNPLANEPK